jgi:hypothetical protein
LKVPNVAQPLPHLTSWRSPILLAGHAVNGLLFVNALVLSRTDPAALRRLLLEDGLVEWLQFLALALLAGVLAVAAWRQSTVRGGMARDVLVLGALSVVVALAALEEVSWFQRVLRFETPDFFSRHNRQGETNLHNMAVGASSINKLVLVKLIFALVLAHNLVLPVLVERSPRWRRTLEAWGLFVPPLAAALPFLGLVLLSHLAIRDPRAGELSEALVAVHYLCAASAAYLAGVNHAGPCLFPAADARRRASRAGAAVLVLLVFCAWLLALAHRTGG